MSDSGMRMKLLQNLMDLLETLPDKEEMGEGEGKGEVSIEVEPTDDCKEEAGEMGENKMKVLPGKGL